MIHPSYLAQKIEVIFPEIVSLRRDLHSHPELSEQEIRTEDKICEYLTSLKIPFQRGIAGHGVVATIQLGNPCISSPAVGIRADIDALPIQEAVDVSFRSQVPGVMHACGHDIHTAILLGTAKMLKEISDKQFISLGPGVHGDLFGNIDGTVKLFFQPAEETVGGASSMIEAGCLENPHVSAVIGLHIAPHLPAGSIEFCRGKMNAASDEFTITVKGQSAHGAKPHEGADALLSACQIVSSLQSVVSRRISPLDSAVVTVGQFQSGTKNNIIAKKAICYGILRTLEPKIRPLAKREISTIVKKTAEAFGTDASVDFIESYPALINDAQIEAILEETANQLLPEKNIFFMPYPSMGTDDFSYFCHATKAAYFNLGSSFPDNGKTNEAQSVNKKGEDHPPQSLHSEFLCPDESCMKTGILMETAVVLRLLSYLK